VRAERINALPFTSFSPTTLSGFNAEYAKLHFIGAGGKQIRFRRGAARAGSAERAVAAASKAAQFDPGASAVYAL
jgi:hypothetical protein